MRRKEKSLASEKSARESSMVQRELLPPFAEKQFSGTNKCSMLFLPGV